jgi:hypothetical protein
MNILSAVHAPTVRPHEAQALWSLGDVLEPGFAAAYAPED